MSAWLVVWLVIGVVSTTALVACVAFLVFHAILLTRTVRRVQEDLRPIADEIAEGTSAIGDRAASLRPPIADRRRRGRR
jgi:hypothetical protein